MAEQTGIEWCDATFNPWWGCAEVSPACGHCYARVFAKRVGRAGIWPERGQPGQEHGFWFPSEQRWREPLRWARLARNGRLPDGSENRDGHRPRVFCASMADVFEERPELEQPRRRLFELIAATPELDWLILTKRPDVAREWTTSRWSGVIDGRVVSEGSFTYPYPPNVWMGVSIENARYTWRADVLREIPAAVRFISAEPLLGSLFPYDRSSDGRDADSDSAAGSGNLHVRASGDERDADRQRDHLADGRRGLALPAGSAGAGLVHERDSGRDLDDRQRVGRAPLDLSGIDWVIIGGESGPKARPFHLEHARELIRACRDGCSLCAEGMQRVLVGGGESRGYAPIWWHDDGRASFACTAHGQRGPAVFVKQLGAKPITRSPIYGDSIVMDALRDRKGGDPDEWPADIRIREFPQ